MMESSTKKLARIIDDINAIQKGKKNKSLHDPFTFYLAYGW